VTIITRSSSPIGDRRSEFCQLTPVKPDESMHRILFLCTGNSCRSQMAEAWCRHYRSNRYEPYSAGIERHGLNPMAVRAMADVGIDMSDQTSKTLEELADVDFDVVITVCDHASESCPVFPGAVRVIHRSFDDPPKLAARAASEAEALACYARVRDEIGRFVCDELDRVVNACAAVRRD